MFKIIDSALASFVILTFKTNFETNRKYACFVFENFVPLHCQ